jgi:organic radical activating enzyme
LKYLVKEIFGPTIQGEGRHTGTPTTFIRMSKCNKWNGRADSKPNVICNFCDTDFVGGDWMTADDILAKVNAIGLKTVVITGGEPLLQIVKGDLISDLIHDKFLVMIETNGSLDDKGLLHWASVTISPKQKASETFIPKSGADIKILYPWIDPEIIPDKFINMDGVKNIYIQPIDRPNEDNTKGAFQEVVKLRKQGYKNTFLSLQTHKYGGFQ